MANSLTLEQKEQFSEIFSELGESLDITKLQHEAAVNSYQFVGGWLAAAESPLSPYKPEIRPQGSFLLGTMTQPVHEDDDLDIDLVCRLEGKNGGWTQYDLKQIVGDRLKAHGTLKRQLDEEGRRCWTLLYSDSAKFHMDVLPSIVNAGYMVLLEKTMLARDLANPDQFAIRITDKKSSNYYSAVNPEEWLKCNPFGYAAWFHQQAAIEGIKLFSLTEAIQPVPKYQKDKLPLQRVVQILKRHRDLMFNGDEDKPISIIITTLAARAYSKQRNVLDALRDIVHQMPYMIEERYDDKLGKRVKWIANPVNREENFADKWHETPNKKQENFYKWHKQLSVDVDHALGQTGLFRIQEALNGPFGKKVVTKAFSNMSEKAGVLRENGGMKMAAGTGILGTAGRTNVPYHNNFGKDA
jgi:hypothetical protein